MWGHVGRAAGGVRKWCLCKVRVNGREVVGRSKESWEIGGMVESM